MEAHDINVQEKRERERESIQSSINFENSLEFFSGLTFYLFLRLPFFLFVDHIRMQKSLNPRLTAFLKPFFSSFGSQSLWKKIITLWSKVQLTYQPEVKSELFKGQVKYIGFSIWQIPWYFCLSCKCQITSTWSSVQESSREKEVFGILTHLQLRLDQLRLDSWHGNSMQTVSK